MPQRYTYTYMTKTRCKESAGLGRLLVGLAGTGHQQYNGSAWTALVPVPPGGTTGQVPAKASNDDRDVEWVTP
jgi:hypothetical protein